MGYVCHKDEDLVHFQGAKNIHKRRSAFLITVARRFHHGTFKWGWGGNCSNEGKVSARTPIRSRLWPQFLEQRLNRLLRPLVRLTAPLASPVLQVSMMPRVHLILRRLASLISEEKAHHAHGWTNGIGVQLLLALAMEEPPKKPTRGL